MITWDDLAAQPLGVKLSFARLTILLRGMAAARAAWPLLKIPAALDASMLQAMGLDETGQEPIANACPS